VTMVGGKTALRLAHNTDCTCFNCVTDGNVEVGWGLPQPGPPASCSPVSAEWRSYVQRTQRSPLKPCQEEQYSSLKLKMENNERRDAYCTLVYI